MPHRSLCVLLLAMCVTPAIRAAPQAHPTAAMTRAMARAEQSLQQNETQIAESLYRSALLEGWLLRGALAVADGDLAAAQRAFVRASSSTVETRRPLHWRALVHLQLDQTTEAIALLTRIVSQNPGDVKARRLLAQALVDDGRHEEAAQELEEARTVAPGDTEITYTLANGYLRLGKLDQARELYDQVAGERPIPLTHLLIGRSYGSFGHYEHAQAAFETALEMDPDVRRGHYYLGTVKLLAAGRDSLEPAIQHFAEAKAREPEDPMTNLYLGTALLATRRFSEAIPPLEIAARQDRTAIDAWRYLGGCYLGLDRASEAITVLRRALAASAQHTAEDRQLSAIHYQLGQALRQEGVESEAADHFASAAKYSKEQVEDERDSLTRFMSDNLEQEEKPARPTLDVDWLEEVSHEQRAAIGEKVTGDLARAYLNLGILHLQAERPGRAAELIAQAADVDPEFPGVQYTLGVAHFNAERFDLATEPLSLAFEHDPANAALKRMVALAHFNTDSYARAVELLRDDDERGANPSLEYAYGLALVRSDHAREAQTVFDRLLSRNAEWPELHVAMGQAHAKQGDYDAAVASLERALELQASVPEARATLGELHLRQGKLDTAEQHLRGELEARPDDHTSRYHLATVLELNRRPGEAREQLEVLLDARPDFADARYLLGKILLADGAAEDALTHLEAAAGLAPEDPNIFNQLGQAYQRLGQTEQAKRQFELFRELKQKERDNGS